MCDDNYTLYSCEESPCKIHNNILLSIRGIKKEQILNSIYHFLILHPTNYGDYYWKFYYDETDKKIEDERKINTFNLLKNYPKTITERIDKIMLNFAHKYPTMGDSFTIIDLEKNGRLLFSECNYLNNQKNNYETTNLFNILHKMKYVDIIFSSNVPEKNEFVLTYEAWQKIDELKAKSERSKQIFIAMSFDDDVKYIKSAFQEAINFSGYFPRAIDEKEHNNYIMDELFYEIKNSIAVVVDVTKQNYGAYYEAGYAYALGKEVIFCCKKDIFYSDKKPHFDVSQVCMVIWEDEKDLVEKLSKRIKYTIAVKN